MNRTLVELARAMITARSLPEFLWEYAILHAAYIRNRCYTKTLSITPYEIWFKRKPNISHLREFGAPVWVLLQGQKQQRKMLPKSKQHYYVGYEDGPKAIKYYSAETRKVLISRNFHFLNLSDKETLSEDFIIDPDPAIQCERELEDDTPQAESSENEDDAIGKGKQKRNISVTENKEGPAKRLRKTPHIDYRYLNDPFCEDIGHDETLTSAEIIFSVYIKKTIRGTDPKSYREARESLEWPQWEKAIQTELAQLKSMGTWEMVTCPKDAKPIFNKWVFARKFGKTGELLKYKARLVAKGCAQRPGYDFDQTFSSVVRLETIQGMLAIVPSKRLKI